VYLEVVDFYRDYVITASLYCAETSYVHGRSGYGDVKPGQTGMAVPGLWEHAEWGPGLVAGWTSVVSTDYDDACDC